MMDKLKVYQLIAGLMVAVNIGILVFFLGFPPHRGKGGPRAIDQLEMTKEQTQEFHQMARRHQTQMQAFNRQQKDALRPYFRQLSQDTAGAGVPEVPAEALTLEEEKIRSTYEHLLEVKGILTADQREGYPEFVDQSIQRILGSQGKRRPRPKD
ncbi:MAG: hypothetical protein AAFP02_12260 [Bacteroidota bacterium]